MKKKNCDEILENNRERRRRWRWRYRRRRLRLYAILMTHVLRVSVCVWIAVAMHASSRLRCQKDCAQSTNRDTVCTVIERNANMFYSDVIAVSCIHTHTHTHIHRVVWMNIYIHCSRYGLIQLPVWAIERRDAATATKIKNKNGILEWQL